LGGTTVFVSHSRDEVYRLCDSVCILSDGRSEPREPVKQLFDTPQTLSACLLSGCKNYSRIQSAGPGLVRALDWNADLRIPGELPEGATHLGVRAHYIGIVSGPGENVLRCKVDRVIDDVFSTIVMLDTGAGQGPYSLLRIEMTKDKWAALGEPREVYAHIAPGDIMLLRQ
jgi:molybdate transport system ATP-binding protein